MGNPSPCTDFEYSYDNDDRTLSVHMAPGGNVLWGLGDNVGTIRDEQEKGTSLIFVCMLART